MATTTYAPRLVDKYKKDVIPALMKKFGYTTVMQAPKLTKICVNRGVNGAVTDKKLVDIAVEELSTITGQKAVATMSKKDISNFKLREGEPLGVKVTLRGRVMWEFLERLIKMALPVVRDFRGVSPKAFDGKGNYTLGITDQSIFPEIEIDKIKRQLGFDICIVTSATTDDAGRELLRALGMPFRDHKPAAASQSEAAAA